MGLQGKASDSANSIQRVKIYRLNDDGKWDDRGTGHVNVDYIERSEELALFVIDEEDNETLLAHRISTDEIYRRQEDTIISWRDPEYSTDLALSFQEATGCSYVWDHICSVQRNLHFNTLNNLEIGPRPAVDQSETSGTSQANDESFHAVNSDLRELPAVELSTLPLIVKTVLECGIADQLRLTELLLHDQGFFRKLMDLFRICEDQENIDGLHMISKLIKGIILLNSPQIFEKMFGDDFIMDIIGCLEYDPEVPHVQHHRTFLKEHVVFKEAIPIKDPLVLSKIHQTYRVGYIKDVILPRVVDEAVIANLNSIIHANNGVVISLLKDDSIFIQELFSTMRSSTTSAESKKNLVFFMQEFCCLSKSLQMVQQLRLFRDLMNEGIFDIITDALQTQDKRLVLTGTDILILFLNLDPNLLRTYVIRQERNPLLGLLVKGMITDFGEDMHCQFLEILRSLLDSYTSSGSQRDTIIEIFYEKHLDQLIDVITLACSPEGDARSIEKSAGSGGVDNEAITTPEILSNICELLCFCVLHHPYRIKCNFLTNNVMEKVLLLTHRKEKFLVVAAVRFVRSIISRNDDHLQRHIVKNNILKPVIEAFVGNGDRYNLLNSAVLELFEYIKKQENLKRLIIYIVDSFWNQLVKFDYLETIQALKVRYEQSLEICDTRSTINVVDSRKRIDDRAPEKEEEDYFNEDSDEEDTTSVLTSHTPSLQARPDLPNGASVDYPSLRPGSGGLVDYDDDEDEDDYNPPSRNRPETSIGVVGRTEDSPPKLKRKSTSNEAEELELTKKQKTDKNSKDGLPGKKVISTTRVISQIFCGNCSLDESSQNEKEPVVPKSCSNCLPNTLDTRESTGEDHPLIPQPNNNNSSSDPGVNGTNITGSEPYSVR